MIQLGDKVRDTISGFEGIATARHQYMYGCVRISVTPKTDKAGKHQDTQSFDEPQLEVVEAKQVAATPKAKRHGPGDVPAPKRTPRRD